MKDNFDMVQDIRSLINVPAITSLIDGKIYPNIRPDNSQKADLVVNGLGVTNTQQQIGSGNINGYVPKINQGGILVADQARLKTLGKAIVDLVDGVYKDSFRVYVEDTPEIVRDTDGSYFVNIGFKYYSIQEEFKTI